MADTNTPEFWVGQVNTKIEEIVNALKNYVEDFSLDVEVLPDDTDISTYTGVAAKLYLLKDTTEGKDDNWYNEYLWIEDKMELVGTTKADIDNFYTKDEIVEMLKSYYLKTETYSKTEVDDALALKADKADTYTKDETVTQINTLVGETLEDYYTKSAADNVFATISNLNLKADKSAVYTTTEMDSFLADKANAADVYTKDGVNTLLSGKADAATTYNKDEVDNLITTSSEKHYLKSETYTQSEVNNLLDGKVSDTELADIAFSGSYNDLTDKPDLPSDITVDGELSNTSTNAIQNKVVTEALALKANDADLAAVAKSGSYNDLADRPEVPETIYVDAALDAESENPVQNKVIVTALADKANTADVYAKADAESMAQGKIDTALENYYPKASVYTKTEVDGLIADFVETEIVDALPEVGVANTLYMIPNPEAVEGSENQKLLYIWNTTTNVFDPVGGAGGTSIDPDEYYTKTETDTLLNKKVNGDDLTTTLSQYYVKTDTYSQTEVNELIDGCLSTDGKAASAATADTATSATKAQQDADGNVISTTYVKVADLLSYFTTMATNLTNADPDA
jgi:hypothetical protein